MCGRFTLTSPADAVRELFGIDSEILAQLKPRYNIAPTQTVPAVIGPTGDDAPPRQLVLLRWGLIPSWAKEARIGAKMINARAETVAEKPSFRSAFKRSRCLIPADGYYEWTKQGDAKKPMRIRRKDRAPFVFAGLKEHWSSPDGEPIDSCTIITTKPNRVLGQIHHRMPAILDPTARDVWLDPDAPADVLRDLLGPCPDDEMEAYAVSALVNSARNNDPACIDPACIDPD